MERTLENFLLAADCAKCERPIRMGEQYIIAGNPSVTWKFHYACWQKLPKKFRRGLDVYGGQRAPERRTP